MNQCRDAEAVVRVLASYEFKNRIWIFLELMDDDLTNLLEKNYETYSENIVKYMLR